MGDKGERTNLLIQSPLSRIHRIHRKRSTANILKSQCPSIFCCVQSLCRGTFLKTSCLCRASTAPAAPCPLAPAESPTLAPKTISTAETMATTKVPVVLLVYARAASFVPARKKWGKNGASGTVSECPSSKFRPCAGKKPRQPSPTLFSFIFKLFHVIFCLRSFSRHAIWTLVSVHCARSEPFYPYHIHTYYTHTHTHTCARTHTIYTTKTHTHTHLYI